MKNIIVAILFFFVGVFTFKHFFASKNMTTQSEEISNSIKDDNNFDSLLTDNKDKNTQKIDERNIYEALDCLLDNCSPDSEEEISINSPQVAKRVKKFESLFITAINKNEFTDLSDEEIYDLAIKIADLPFPNLKKHVYMLFKQVNFSDRTKGVIINNLESSSDIESIDEMEQYLEFAQLSDQEAGSIMADIIIQNRPGYAKTKELLKKIYQINNPEVNAVLSEFKASINQEQIKELFKDN